VHARVSNVGGRITRWDLLKYQKRDQQGNSVPLPLVVNGLLSPQGLVVHRAGEPPTEAAFNLKTESVEPSEAHPVSEIVFAKTDRYALESTETLRVRIDGYHIETVLQVKNLHSSPQAAEFDLRWRTQWPEKDAALDGGQRPTGVVEKANGQVRRTELGAVQESNKEGEWIALESKWHLIAFIPQSEGIKLLQGKTPEGAVDVGLRFSPPALAPGQSWEGRATLYIGPKEYDRLKGVYGGLEQTIHYGDFLVPFLPMEWFSVPLLWLLKVFYRFSGNYGVAIILLTIIIKVVFYPFTHLSMKSMKGMQALQPQINALRAKYKNDRQRLQQETMELYRKHRINPMGGCLPMLVQVPIFYALYLTLDLSVELQGANFLCFGRLWGVDLWICDLSKADPIYVLPILMGASWFIQQKMTPTVGDPRQAKMMLLMPIVFTFMFFTFPAGLVLYWFVNNILSIAQQLYTDRKAAKA
jgi:YidC/Oxa1 family membrane protein insertase